MITIIDYGAGNIHSLEGALGRLGLESLRAPAPGGAAPAGPLLLPGVGHFGAARAALVETGWWEALPSLVREGRPLLGICLGLQLLCEGSEESPGEGGLGLLQGRARLLGPGVKVPHMGWAPVRRRGDHPALEEEGWLYFVHSFALDSGPGTLLEARHGRPFSALEGRGKILGFQGHPEKSGAYGQRLLGRVLAWMGEEPCA
jgi:imidazole glycerol phosphate synthase glutamine amidotransferase subunit